MDWVALGELLTLLAIGLLTPGPNALTCFGHSGLFGPKANIKLIAGMVIGFVTIELSVGLLVDAVSDSTAAMNVLHWIGMVFLGAMVVAMFRFDPASVKVENNIEGMLGLKVGIGMQFVNGKEWAFVIIMMTKFIEPLGGGMTGISTIIVDKNIDNLLEVAEKQLLLVKGEVMYSGDSQGLKDNPALLETHLGVA